MNIRYTGEQPLTLAIGRKRLSVTQGDEIRVPDGLGAHLVNTPVWEAVEPARGTEAANEDVRNRRADKKRA